MTVQAVKGEMISVDSSTLRYLIDKEYATKLDAELEELQFARDELKKTAHDNPPPAEWYNQPERDLRLDSWECGAEEGECAGKGKTGPREE